MLTRTVWDTPTYALRDASHTFVYSTKTTEFSLFDRTASPRREDKDADFAPRAPIALREMYRQHLLAWVAAQRKPAVDGGKAGCIDPDQCEQMKALGYLDAKTICRTAPCEK